MKANRILAIAVTAIGLGFFSNQAQAAPLFLTPDTNFVSHGSSAFSWTGNGSHLSFNLNINTTSGDFMAIDMGTGFSAATGTISAQSETSSSGVLTLSAGEAGSISGNLLFSKLNNSLVGKDLFAEYRVTSSTMTGVHVGSLIVLDGLVFNITSANGVSQGAIKGDVAPVVPEPASLSLLLLGLGGMTAAARRRLS